MNHTFKEHKNIRISTPRLVNERKLDNKSFQGGNLFIHHINSQHKIYDMIQMRRPLRYIY